MACGASHHLDIRGSLSCFQFDLDHPTAFSNLLPFEVEMMRSNDFFGQFHVFRIIKRDQI